MANGARSTGTMGRLMIARMQNIAGKARLFIRGGSSLDVSSAPVTPNIRLALDIGKFFEKLEK